MSFLTLTDQIAPGAPASGKTRLFSGSALPLQSPGLRGSNASGINALYGGSAPWNLLRNSGFWFAQRQVPGTNTLWNPAAGSRMISADGWGVSQRTTTSMSYQRFDSSGFGENILSSRYYGCFNRNGPVTSDQIIVTQVIDGIETDTVRGRLVRFTGKIKGAAQQSLGVNLASTIQIALLSWTGTVDAMGATLFSATANAFTSGDNQDPVLNTSWSYVAPARSVGLNCVGLNNSYQGLAIGSWQIYSGTFLVPSATKNIAVMIWDSTSVSASGGSLFLGDCMLTDGEQYYDYTHLGIANEYQRVARFYQKSNAIDTDPTSTPGVNTGELHFPANVAGATAFAGVSIRFPVRMYRTPVSVVLKNPAAAGAQVRNVTLGTDCTVCAAVPNSDSGAWINGVAPASTAAGNNMSVHWTADAEL